MFNFYSGFIINTFIFLIVVAIIVLLFYLVKKKEKITKTLIFIGIISFFILILSGTFLINYIRDLPYVLHHKTEMYKGKCEISVAKSVFVDFENHFVSFSSFEYQGLEDGTYKCIVEYFPYTEEGYSIKILNNIK